MSAEKFHLRGLNGLRAIAAFAVVLSHTLQASPQLGLPQPENGLQLARYGVTIFFAISGFLITYLLLMEIKKTATVNIKAFYIRRALRIWPLYYFYLLLVVITILVFIPDQMNAKVLPFYVVLCANIPFILDITLPMLAHYWSLGVEEQFYIFWPWIVRKVRNLDSFLLVFILVFFVLKVAAWVYLKKTSVIWPYTFIEVCRFHCMAIGGLGAYWLFRKNSFFMRIVYNRFFEAGAWVMLFSMAFIDLPLPSLISNECVAIMSVFLIVNVSAERRKVVSLDFPIFDFLGKISYGIYVYHKLIIFFVAKAISSSIVINADSTLRYALFMISVSGFTILASWLSYTYFEKKFLVLKERFMIVRSTGSFDKKKITQTFNNIL